VRDEFHSSPEGLTSAEAQRRRLQYGANAVTAQDVRWWNILFRQFASSFVYLLIAAALLAFFLKEYLDAGAIFSFVLINASLGFFQEYRSEKTVQLLQRYVVRRAKVRREGKERLCDSTDIVPGDIVMVENGDVIPADLRFFEDHALEIDESLLTGESAPVTKTSSAIRAGLPDAFANIGFSGTTVVGGWGEGVAVATGSATMFGDVAQLTAETVRESGFDRRLSTFSAFILRVVLITLALVFFLNLLLHRGSNISGLVIFSIALAVSVIPEALPVVTTFSLSRGASRLAKQKVVVKRLSAIEDLGSIEVLCTDKTGTITENQLTVDDVLSNDRRRTVFSAALAASLPEAEAKEPNNAFDRAVWTLLSDGEKHDVRSMVRLDEYPFDPDRRRNSVLVAERGTPLLIVRGAPESVLPGSENVNREDRAHILQWCTEQGRLGRRVLAIAHKHLQETEDYSVEEETHDLNYLGVISFVDPIKHSTIPAIQRAKKLGIRIVMLTGDSPEVAGAVAFYAKLAESSQHVMTGDSFDSLSNEAKRQAADSVNVFARVSPQQKFSIIKNLEERHEVGFLGEGINDAPALKAANVAIVVNDAADVAREAADIILLKQSLQVIIDGITEGRRVFANTVKYIRATLTSNFGNFYAIAVASLLVDFLPMLPLQILLLNLLSDFPMIAIATDSVEDVELAKPKGYRIREIALFSLLLGAVSTVFDFLYFGIFSRLGASSLQTYWFMGSILTELLFLFSARTTGLFFKAQRPSSPILWLSGAAAILTIIIPFTGWGQTIFQFTHPAASLTALVVSIALAYLVITEIVKQGYHRYVVKRGYTAIGATS
jgi:Mg2+-importing ATPase